MRHTLILLASLVFSAGTALATCNLDKTGTAGNAWADMPKGYLDATGARTLDDFVNAAANQIFLTGPGSEIMVTALNVMVGPFGPAGFAYKNPPPIIFHGYGCNEIGQCIRTQLTVYLSGQPDVFMNGLAGFLSSGLFKNFFTEYFVINYEIVAADPDGNLSDIRDFRPSTIIKQQRLKERYTLSTDGQENVDMRCRDNAGKLTNGTPASGGVSDNDESVPWLWENNIPPPAQPARWECWKTPTGVACRRVEPHPTFQ